jgi:hypothetical protein
MPGHKEPPPAARSSLANSQRREPQHWPSDRRFRILSLDGGGIKGIFSASFLSTLEEKYLNGEPITDYFDLITGTSTGGIIALGLGAGLKSSELLKLYEEKGGDVFPAPQAAVLNQLWASIRKYFTQKYSRKSLEKLLSTALDNRIFGDSKCRLCIPSFDGIHSEVFVYKTPHHKDYKIDRFETMVNIGLATAAAPTFFRPKESAGYTLVDGGVWANNPIMLGVLEALICFDISRDQIDVLSIGCSDQPYIVTPLQKKFGGIFAWRHLIFASMRLQSLAVTNQARLLLGPKSVVRIDPPIINPPIPLDDWGRSVAELKPLGQSKAEEFGAHINSIFLQSKVSVYLPTEIPTTV